jgi:hypothetical protein
VSVINSAPLLAAAGGDYTISRSVRLRASASAYLNRTFGTPTDGKKWTYSFWMKKAKDVATLGHGSGHLLTTAGSGAQGFLGFGWNTGGDIVFGYGGYARRYTSGIYRDPSAWYHIVVAVDTTQATEANRALLYINGASVAWVTNTSITQNDTTQINQAVATNIGRQTGQPYESFDGYFTEMNFIDGQQLTASSFGETDAITGVWKPKKYAGSYGTNGFYLNFSDNSSNTATTIGKDYSGNGNNWTPNSISVTSDTTYDSMIDVPNNYADGGTGRGNYATLNSINKGSNSVTLSEGNLAYTSSGNTGACRVLSTIGMTTGKWYCEFVGTGNSAYNLVGIALSTESPDAGYLGASSSSYGYYASNGYKYNSGSSSAYGATYGTGDIIGIAFDADAGTLTFYKNGTSQGVAYSGIPAGTYYFGQGDYSVTFTGAFNFGQRPFSYTPPTGYLALNTQNLPDSTIKQGNKYFDIKTRTGTGATATVSGYGFTPDFVWIKGRSNANPNYLADTVRGANKYLVSDTTAAEDTSLTGELTAFTSDGFTLGSSAYGYVNYSGNTYVNWAWKESATAGFDIVTYTGDGTTSASRTIAHSLGVKPAFIITKKRSSGTTDYGWSCWHKDLGGNYGIWLHSTAARNVGMWTGYSSISSTVFTPPDKDYGNESGQTYVNYLFAEVAGFSKFGSYTGNGSTDGTFVYLGFRPKFVMFKRTDSTGDWVTLDTSRSQSNAMTNRLYPNASYAEDTTPDIIDTLSNGFKLRISTVYNVNGGTYIYAAFAENPFKNSLAR